MISWDFGIYLTAKQSDGYGHGAYLKNVFHEIFHDDFLPFKPETESPVPYLNPFRFIHMWGLKYWLREKHFDKFIIASN